MPGTEVIDGRYELTDLLGRGGMGEVWAAYDRRLDRSVAVKLLTPRSQVPGPSRPLAADDPAVIRFTREARLMAKLDHPYVPVIHDAGTHAGSRLYLVMQRVRGHTLSQLLGTRGPFPPAWAAAVGAQVASVLDQAHRLGVVHRDLTPRNVMLTPDGTVRVLDFGIATALSPPDDQRLTQTGSVTGTPGYISPEQGKGQDATPLSDLYALGCVLYEILAGRPPFTAADPLALVVRHITDQPDPLDSCRDDLPAQLTALVCALMAKDPEDRPACAAQVQALLEPWALAAVPKPARPAAARQQRYADLPGNPTLVRTPRPAATPSAAEPEPEPQTKPLTPPQPTVAASDTQAQARRLVREGRLSQAVALLRDDLRSASQGRVPHDGEVVTRRLALLAALVEAGELRRARDGYRELADLLAAVRPATDLDLLACRVEAATCLAGLGSTTEALAELRHVLPDQQWMLGASHPAVLRTRREIATLLAGAGSLTEALRELRALRAEQQAVLEPGDPAHTQVDRLIGRLEQLTRTLQLPAGERP